MSDKVRVYKLEQFQCAECNQILFWEAPPAGEVRRAYCPNGECVQYRIMVKPPVIELDGEREKV